jgi:Terpene synthase family 2, C-terminal metal binding
LSNVPSKVHEYTRWLTVFSLLIFAWDDLMDDVLQVEEALAPFPPEPDFWGQEKLSAHEDRMVKLLCCAFPKNSASNLTVFRENPFNAPSAYDQLQQALAQFYTDLARRCPAAWKVYGSYLEAKLLEAAQANRQELVWRQQLRSISALNRPKMYPSYEAYMENGLLSVDIGAIMGVLLLLVAQDVITESNKNTLPPVAALSASLVDLFDSISGLCGYVIRQANDIRSLARDKVEQKANAVLIVLAQNPNWQEEQAIGYIVADRDKRLAELTNLVAATSTAPLSRLAEQAPFLSGWGEAQLRTAWFAVKWYKHREFHHFSRADLSALLT